MFCFFFKTVEFNVFQIYSGYGTKSDFQNFATQFKDVFQAEIQNISFLSFSETALL